MSKEHQNAILAQVLTNTSDRGYIGPAVTKPQPQGALEDREKDKTDTEQRPTAIELPSRGRVVPTEEVKRSAKLVATVAALKKPFERALIRNLRMLNRHLWELRGEVSMVCEQIVIERNEAAKVIRTKLMILRRFSRGIPVVSLFALISLAGVELSAAPKPEKYRQARDLEGRNEISKAVVAYRGGVSAKPSSSDEADACVRLGTLLLRQGQSEDAAKEFRKVLEAPSQVVGKTSGVLGRARRGIFFALLDSGKYDEADRFIEDQIRADGRPREATEKALAERRKDISRHKAEAPSRKAIHKVINEFLRAIVARDLHGLKAKLSSRFPKKQADELERQLPSSKISSMEPQIVDIQVAGAEAKATAVVSAAESNGDARPRSFFFKMVLDGDQWKIDSF